MLYMIILDYLLDLLHPYPLYPTSPRTDIPLIPRDVATRCTRYTPSSISVRGSGGGEGGVWRGVEGCGGVWRGECRLYERL